MPLFSKIITNILQINNCVNNKIKQNDKNTIFMQNKQFTKAKGVNITSLHCYTIQKRLANEINKQLTNLSSKSSISLKIKKNQRQKTLIQEIKQQYIFKQQNAYFFDIFVRLQLQLKIIIFIFKILIQTSNFQLHNQLEILFRQNFIDNYQKLFAKMFETIVEKLLSKILGQYIEDFNSDNLKIGLWSGQVVLKDVKLKKETMKKLNLPFKIRHSILKCLKMNIPWSTLATSKIQVLIEGLELLISEVHPSQWELKNQKIIQLRKDQIKAFTQSTLKDFAARAAQSAKKQGNKSANKQEDEGYFSNLVVKIIDNLQITIKDIHIRYEDLIYNEYSFGATLQQLKIFTVNQKDQPIFIDRTKKQFKNQPLRKRLILSNFGIYWNQKSQFFQENNIGQSLKKSIANQINRTSNGMNYMILMSFEARLLYRQKGQQFVQPQINLFLDFDSLKFQISNKQLQQIVSMGERLQTFSTQVKRKNKIKITKQQAEKNGQFFEDIFPKFYKNQKISPQDMTKFQDILQKMEVQTFKPIMKRILQDKQKERILKQKKSKGWGWFSGPKQISEEQQKQIETFLTENFGKQVQQTTRPSNYFHTQVNLTVRVMEVVISNTKNNIKEGIRAKLLNIGTQFKLRQAGYLLKFGINDVSIDLFNQIQSKGRSEETKHFLKKLVNSYEDGDDIEYVRLVVQGSPIDRPYVDTYIKLVTQQVLIMFDPKIISIATNFANIKVNAQNSSAALQAYGQIKQKTAKSVNQTIESKKKSFIYINIKLKSITAILYFDPSKSSGDIWAITLGETRIYTDKQTLSKTQSKPNQPTQKYTLELNKISLRYFQNQNIFMEKRINGDLQNQKRLTDVVTDLNIDVVLAMYKQSTVEIPKINVLTEMKQLKANLTAFTYQNLKKIGNCFADKQSDQQKIQQKSDQKQEIIKNLKKIGFIYTQDNALTKTWTKYVGMLSNNYIYLYNDKKDIKYVAYYYVKNSKIALIENPDPQGKQFSFQFKNKVDNQIFGFDKKILMKQWMQEIKKCSDVSQEQLQTLELTKNASKSQKKDQNENVQKIETDPNMLNYIVGMKFRAINIKTYLTEEQQVEKQNLVEINLQKLTLKVSLHQKKTVVELSLLSIDLKDNIIKYKMKSLQRFLYTQTSAEKQKLIDIKVLLVNETHPEYKYIDTELIVSFGKLACNYKAETVSSVMSFFIPQNEQSKSKQETVNKYQQHHQEADTKKSSLAISKKKERFSIKLNFKMNQIALRLINTKTNIFFCQITIESLEMNFAMSDLRMAIKGKLQQISLKDFSNYPNTIISQQQSYDTYKYIITSESRKYNKQENQNADLIYFEIDMYNKPNKEGKKMILGLQLSGLEVSYVQQPVLRLITYLNTQLLPSLSPKKPLKPKRITQNSATQQKIEQMKQKDRQNFLKPEMNTMKLQVTVNDITVMIQPRNNVNEELKLKIKALTVKNESIQRAYLANSDQKAVLVQNYHIVIIDMGIFANYLHPITGERCSYSLTPDIDLDLQVDLIQNPIYYQKTYGSKFLNGMRIKIWMDNFFMRINHQDYNFMMKCLYWNVTYDDNAEFYLFDPPEPSTQQQKREIPSLYFNLKIQSISLFIIEKQLPLAFLLLNSLFFKFIKKGENSMFIKLDIVDMIGSSFIHKQKNSSIEKGMFNSFGYQREIQSEKLKKIQNLLSLFKKNIQSETKTQDQFVITFQMDTDEQSNSFMGIKLQQLKLVVEMKTLLTLSKLALMEEYIQPPKSKIQPLLSEEQKQIIEKQKKEKENKKAASKKSGKSQIHIVLRDFLAGLADTERKNFFIMEGQVIGKLINFPQQTEQSIIKLSKNTKQLGDKFLYHSNNSFELRNFKIYFCNSQQMQKKRYILKPFTISAYMQKSYELIRAQKHKQKAVQKKKEQNSDQKSESLKMIKQGKQNSKQMKKMQKQSNKQINKMVQEGIQQQKPQNIIILLTQVQATMGSLIFEASIKDLLKINQIIQDNLTNLNKYNQNENANKIQGKVLQGKQDLKSKLEQKIDEKQKQRKLQLQNIEKTKEKLKKQIFQKTKARVFLNPLQILVINDCDRNFMPVLKFIIQPKQPLFQSNIIHAHLSVNLIMNLNFFNPRSSKWQPVIQKFETNFDYLNLIGQKHNKTNMLLKSSTIQQLSELKINISTQFIASLMTTLQKSKIEQKTIKDYKPSEKQEEIEISPFIIQNITNKNITIKRKLSQKEGDFVLKPMFKGTVRLTQDSQYLQFLIGEGTTNFKVSLQHYGVISINKTIYYIEFKVDKLNRIIRFLSNQVLQNELFNPIYVKRYFRNGVIDKEDFKLDKKDMLALDGVKQLQISLNKRSYSIKTSISDIKEVAMKGSASIIAQSGKFLVKISQKRFPNKFCLLQVWPPLIIYNCLPKQFTIKFIISKGLKQDVYPKEIKAQQMHEVYANSNPLTMKYQILIPGFFWNNQLIQMTEDSIGKQMSLLIGDRQKGETTINYIFDQKVKGRFSFIIYCKTFLISELEDDVLAYGNRAKDEADRQMEKYYVLGGQRAKSIDHDDDIIIIGSQYGTKLRVCGDGCLVDFSQPFSLGGIGIIQNRRIVIKRKYNGEQMQLFTTIGVDVSIKQMFKNLQIFSKMITIHSRAIIVNSTSKRFTIRQEGSSKQIFSVEKGEKKNLYFTLPQNPNHPRGVIFTGQNSTPSKPINISQLGTLFFKVEDKVLHNDEYYKILIQEVSKYIFYEITQLTEQTIPYQIQNKMPKAKVLLKFNGVTLSQGQKFSFINQSFKEQHIIKIILSHQNSNDQKLIVIMPDDLNFAEYCDLDVQIDGLKGTVHAEIKVEFDDKKKYIIIDQVSHTLGYNEQQTYDIGEMNIKLKKITLSFIQNHISIQKPFQSFCFSMQGIEFIKLETNLEMTYQAKINFIQFDQQEPFNMPNPVILTPYKMKQFLKQENPKCLFNILYVQNKKFQQNTFINKLEFLANDLVLKFSQYFIDVVMQISKQFVEVINYKQQDYFVQRSVDKWGKIQIPKEGAKTFIKHIKISQFVLEISLQISLDKLSLQASAFFGTILNALGVVMTNIQGAPITLDGIQLQNCVDNLSGIIQKLKDHYVNSLIKQLYKVFGSLNIIGNPMGFFRNISTGFKDLKDKPSEGFVQGPLEFGRGLGQGVTSVIAHSIGGALNSVQKVTGTISTGLAVLAFDKQFQQLRQKQKMEKPQHVFEGLEKGGKAIFYGFRQGIKGVFMQPYENTKKQGVVGFFKGTAKGLAGLVIKPVTGVIDFASKTTQGLKNTALYLEDKPNQNRVRYPRVFYTECYTVKQYDSVDSKLNAIIRNLKHEQNYQQSFFVQSYLCDDSRYLLVLQDKVLMVRIDREEISWVIQMANFRIEQNNKESKYLKIKDEVEYIFRKSDHNIRISDDAEREKVESQIKMMQNQYNR